MIPHGKQQARLRRRYLRICAELQKEIGRCERNLDTEMRRFTNGLAAEIQVLARLAINAMEVVHRMPEGAVAVDHELSLLSWSLTGTTMANHDTFADAFFRHEARAYEQFLRDFLRQLQNLEAAAGAGLAPADVRSASGERP